MYRQLLILILMFSQNLSQDAKTDINLKGCGTTKKGVNSRIVGGTKTDVTKFPWIVSFQKRGSTKSDHFCGGSIVNQRWLLTAAHCIQGVKHSIQKVRAVVGSTHWDDPKGSAYEIEKIKIHEKYESFNYANDIALIKTKTPIVFKSDDKNTFVNSVCLATPDIQLTETANIYGWGLLGEFQSNSRDLMKTTLNKFDRNKCNDVYKEYIGKLTKQMMCYASPGKDACQGDSGGPLSQKIQGKEIQFGIVSFGLGCGRKENPGIYTNVALYLDWIKKTIKDN